MRSQHGASRRSQCPQRNRKTDLSRCLREHRGGRGSMPQDHSPLRQTSEPNNLDGPLIADPEPRRLISAVEPARAVAPTAAQGHQFKLTCGSGQPGGTTALQAPHPHPAALALSPPSQTHSRRLAAHSSGMTQRQPGAEEPAISAGQTVLSPQFLHFPLLPSIRAHLHPHSTRLLPSLPLPERSTEVCKHKCGVSMH